MINDNLYLTCVARINTIHKADPKTEITEGKEIPDELLYSERMLMVLLDYYPTANNELKIAAQCQHFERWGVSRNQFPMDKKGYHLWRKAVLEYQLNRMTEELKPCKIDDDDLNTIIDILKNRGKKEHPFGQILEDVACIVFVKWYLEPFASKHNIDKVMDIVRKTTTKISVNGIQAIQNLEVSPKVTNILSKI